MRKSALITLIVAMMIAACVLLAQTVTPPKAVQDVGKQDGQKAEQKVVVTPGDKDWTNSSLTLGSMDRVTVRASGRVYYNERPDSAVGPNGLEGDYRTVRPDDAAACADPLPKESHACLIAKVNDEIFKVGSSLTFSGKSGQLFLGINDCTLTGKFGNSGVFGVNIKVERSAIAVKK
jgi:hypothetical protein